MQKVKNILLRPRGALSGGLFFPLTLASYLYGFVCRVRAESYRMGILHPRHLPCRVISVGNLTVGGTGKTPFVIYLARLLSEHGKRVGIVSRGYGRPGREESRLVADPHQIFSGPSQVGEEPYLIARRLAGIPVMVARERAGAGEALCRQFGIDTILLDDGFQHLSLYRDVNLLLIDATDPFGNGFLLPRGTLREPFSALSRADAILLTRMEQNGPVLPDRLEALLREISRRYSLPVLRSSFGPVLLASLTDGKVYPVETIRRKRWFVFSGIGNPQSFRRTVERLGGEVVGERIFSDHFRYSERVIQRLDAEAAGHVLEGVLTTEKDGVKVESLLRLVAPKCSYFSLRMDVAEVEERGLFERMILG